MTSPGDNVLYDKRGPIAYVTLNRPEKRNGIKPDVNGRLERDLDGLSRRPEIRVAVSSAL